MKKLLVFGLLLFAMLGLTMAAGNETFGRDVRQTVMEMHAAQLECRVDFLLTMLDHSEEYTGEDYSEIAGSLESSMEDVQRAADENNLQNFLEAVSNTRSYFREAVQIIRDARIEAIQNAGENKSTLVEQMREDFDSAHNEFTECNVEATRNRIEAEIEANRYWIDVGRDAAENMSEKGYDTGQLEEILDEADENTDDMEQILENEQDINTLLEERKTHWEHHLYLWAEYHHERLNLFLDRILERTDGYEEQVEEIKDVLDKAINVGDDEYYTLGEFKEARGYISEALHGIKDLLKQIKEEASQGGEE